MVFSFFCQVDIQLFLRSVVLYHLCDATTPRGWTAAFGCWPARRSQLWGRELIVKLREHRKKLSDMKIQDTRTGNICVIKRYGCLEKISATFTELSKASVNFIHASCGCGASVWATASYAEQSLISACMKFGNAACSANVADIHLQTDNLEFIARSSPSSRPYYSWVSFSASLIFFISSASSLYFPVTYP